MKNLEIKVHISGESLAALQTLAGTVDDQKKLRAVARKLLNHSLDKAKEAMQSCMEGKIGDLSLDGKDDDEKD